ncbi:MAG: cyclic nucleotide-binding domain-containing protein [Blastocatellia bacterium]|jgi:CRP/FNR family cyclic AMP-dependent transcriptional regulator
MSTLTLEQMIASHPFFGGLDESMLRSIAAGARQVELPAGETIFHQGESADRFYLVRTGRIALNIHTPRRGGHTIQTIEDGEILGWSWLFPPYRWRFDARVVEPVTAIEIDGRRLREQCDLDHDLGYELFRRFAALIGRRLESTRIQLMDLYGVSH